MSKQLKRKSASQDAGSVAKKRKKEGPLLNKSPASSDNQSKTRKLDLSISEPNSKKKKEEGSDLIRVPLVDWEYPIQYSKLLLNGGKKPFFQ
jgi:hypothetical protein